MGIPPFPIQLWINWRKCGHSSLLIAEELVEFRDSLNSWQRVYVMIIEIPPMAFKLGGPIIYFCHSRYHICTIGGGTKQLGSRNTPRCLLQQLCWSENARKEFPFSRSFMFSTKFWSERTRRRAHYQNNPSSLRNTTNRLNRSIPVCFKNKITWIEKLIPSDTF